MLGILNCTPDSFSDGGRYDSPSRAARRLEEIVKEGADWVDVGGESTRPGAAPVPADEEWRRIRPVLEEARRSGLSLPLSVDTTKAEVAERALDLGAALINDVSSLRFDPGIADLAAARKAGLILMHMRGEPRTMQIDPRYDDLLGEVSGFLAEAAQRATRRGVAREQILCDPGIGFGKTVEHNLELIRALPRLAELGYPLVVGASRKAFLGKILDREVGERLEGSLSAHVAAALAGADVVRAHDVAATVRAVRVADAIRAGAAFPGTARSV